MSESRLLVVNADDFGFSAGVSRAIVQAHRDGIVTSTSLMVRSPEASHAVALSRACPALDIGLHLDLGEWTFDNGDWRALYEVADTNDPRAVADEVTHQLRVFRELVGRAPSHIDSHQHVHMRQGVRPVVARAAEALRVPLRHCMPGINYCGNFYGQTTEGESLPGAISVDALLSILANLQPGTTELACHPGEGDDTNTMYRIERKLELEVLCDLRIRDALEAGSITLRAFSQLVSHTASDDDSAD